MGEEYEEEDEEREEEIKRLAAEKRREWDSRELYESSYTPIRQNVSAWWYLVPILFGLLGDIIAYAALRHEDEDTAQGALLLGIVITVVGFLLMWWTGWLF